ncbi:dnaJ homolog subfamily B member 13-like [Ischnura elegans]|uniref:dnaJ homolog subfamily B member 13-like n=1 Tax=Ischnura elegans TaxID=197161 RepID=UPI001ED8847C|nr:dnaJ homolog subfamily B member 13-like [Ischnura elegans]
MGIDYYGIFNLSKCASDPEIKREYRRLALSLHPERKEEDRKEHPQGVTFELVSEAYEVLSDKFLRAVYDQYGEEGLKAGVPGPHEYIQPYIYHGDPMLTFREFFGTTSPYADLLDALYHPLPLYQDGLHIGVRKKDPDVFHPLPLTLKEVFYGGVKQVLIRRRELCEAKSECEGMTRSSQNIVNVKFPPGIESGIKYKFTEAGNQGIAAIPADIIFVTEDIPHPVFKREGLRLASEAEVPKKKSITSLYKRHLDLTLIEEDEENKFDSKEPTTKNGWVLPMAYLSTVKCISLCEALTGFKTTVETIDGKLIRIAVTDVVTPSYQMVIPGEGLPIYGDRSRRRGDLRIRFNIKFPILPLPKRNRLMIQEALTPLEDMGNIGSCTEDLNRTILRDKMNKVALKDQAPPRI